MQWHEGKETGFKVCFTAKATQEQKARLIADLRSDPLVVRVIEHLP